VKNRILFRRRYVRSDGASPRPGESLQSAPSRAAEWLAQAVHPCPARGACGSARSSRSTISGCAADRSHSGDHMIQAFPTNRADPSLNVWRLFQLQYSRNPRRCQAITVSGLTMIRADRQPLQSGESQTHRSRSAKLRCGRWLPFDRCHTRS
jgi:hypothetical protein